MRPLYLLCVADFVNENCFVCLIHSVIDCFALFTYIDAYDSVAGPGNYRRFAGGHFGHDSWLGAAAEVQSYARLSALHRQRSYGSRCELPIR